MNQPEQLRERTKQFVGNQILRSGTAVAANYRAVCRARSKAEFVAKMGIVVEEADETVYWLELISDNGIVAKSKDVGFIERGHRVGGDLYSVTFNVEGRARVNYPISQFPNYSITDDSNL